MQDETDYKNMMQQLEEVIIPAYYQDRNKWIQIMKQSMHDVIPMFSADRMADEYYRKMYQEALAE